MYLGSLIALILLFGCDNDDGNAPNQNQCNFAGLTFTDNNNSTNTLLAEANLTTDFFPNQNGNGIGAMEVYETANPSNFWFMTDVVTLNASGTATMGIGGTNYTVNVVCQRAGNAVGEEFRYDITSGGIEGELCIVIDNVTP